MASLTTNLAAEVGTTIRMWVVFLACALSALFGVVVAFLVFGTKINQIGSPANRPTLYLLMVVITVVMLGLTYGTKYATQASRESFTPLDLIQYITAGFLWPSTWPGLADFLNIQTIPPPTTTSGIDLVVALGRSLGL